MRSRGVAVASLVLAVAAAVVVFEWALAGGGSHNDVHTAASDGATPASLPKLPQSQSARIDTLATTTVGQMAAPLLDRSKIKAPTAAATQSISPPASTPAAPAPDQQVDQRVGTTAVPGDPQSQPEELSEQFMHSRRGDGQHNE